MSTSWEAVRLLCAALFSRHPDVCEDIVQRVLDLVVGSTPAPRSAYATGARGYARVGTLAPDELVVKARVFHPATVQGAAETDYLISKRADTRLHGAVLVRVVRNAGAPAFHLSAAECDALRRILAHWSSCYYLLIDEQYDPAYPFFVRAIELLPFLAEDAGRAVDLANAAARRLSRGADLFVALFRNCQIGQKASIRALTDLAFDWSVDQRRRVVEVFLAPEGLTERYTQTRLFPEP